jgi:hypothetical protein
MAARHDRTSPATSGNKIWVPGAGTTCVRRPSTIGARRGCRDGGGGSRLRQAGKQIGGKTRQRIWIGIDPGREVDEWFGRAREQAPGGTEIAAMQQRFVYAAKGDHVSRACPHCHADRALFRLPGAVASAIGHPVTWIGRLIGALDRLLNRETVRAIARRAAGIVAVLILIVVVRTVAFVVEHELLAPSIRILAVGLLASTLIAQRSLHRHVADVARALERQGGEAGRIAVSHIVGRDTEALDAAGVVRAAIESLAENFSDAVVAPIMWMAIAGLPGAALYKAINTADSMIGHRTPATRPSAGPQRGSTTWSTCRRRASPRSFSSQRRG